MYMIYRWLLVFGQLFTFYLAWGKMSQFDFQFIYVFFDLVNYRIQVDQR